MLHGAIGVTTIAVRSGGGLLNAEGAPGPRTVSVTDPAGWGGPNPVTVLTRSPRMFKVPGRKSAVAAVLAVKTMAPPAPSGQTEPERETGARRGARRSDASPEYWNPPSGSVTST